jgi:acyl-CoA thioesterase
MGRFADDTAVEPLGDGRYAATIDPGWWIQRGPNGGYLAAIVLRAVLAEVGSGGQAPRSLTLHFLRPPVEGSAEVRVEVLRQGRTLATVRAGLVQGDTTCIEALAAVGGPRPGIEFDDAPPPIVPPPDLLEPPPSAPMEIPMRARYSYRQGIGAVSGAGGGEALTGGWIRLADDDPVDHAAVAAFTDGWAPAVFARLAAPVGVPTVDLTIHFRHDVPHRPAWCLVRFRTRLATGGYLEEDGEVWSDDGRLLAQSRQLAAVLGPG